MSSKHSAVGPEEQCFASSDLRQLFLAPAADRLFRKGDNMLCRFLVVDHLVDPTAHLPWVSGAGRWFLCWLLLQHGADPLWSNNAACRWAAEAGQAEVLQLLLKNGGSADKDTLAVACQNGQANTVRVLLAHAAESRAAYEALQQWHWGSGKALDDDEALEQHAAAVQNQIRLGAMLHMHMQEALLVASTRGHESVARALLDYGAYPSTLTAACRNAHAAVVRLLLSRGAKDRDCQDLRFACKAGYLPVAEALLEAGGGDLAKWFCDLLYEASEHGHADVVRLLLQHGADLDVNSVVLDIACEKGHLDIVRMLLEHSTALRSWATAALRNTVSKGHLPVVECLIKHGARVSWALLDYAGCHPEICKLLLAQPGKEFDVEGKSSALSAACMDGHIELVRLLLEHGMDAASMNAALHWATLAGEQDIIELSGTMVLWIAR